jgi:hypothetical protein
LLSTSEITLRFRHWSGPVSTEPNFYSRAIEIACGRPVRIVQDLTPRVDIEIESVYNEGAPPAATTRIHRFIHSKLPGGIKFDGGVHTPNQQPSGNARFRIFATGENERPPEGNWDAYLTFDLHSFGNRNTYVPLWWITCSDLLLPTVAPYLGKELTLDQMLSPRIPDWEKRKKFCVAFVGKAWPFRMHAITALSQIGEVDVYGPVARRSVESKFEIAQQYRFVFAFENDLYPGYVTEKAPEAWGTGAVPLYWGADPEGYLNPGAMINLAEFRSLEAYVDRVAEVDESKELWESFASQPFLLRRPSADHLISLLRRALSPLCE